jgi:hypothetical protein
VNRMTKQIFEEMIEHELDLGPEFYPDKSLDRTQEKDREDQGGEDRGDQEEDKGC